MLLESGLPLRCIPRADEEGHTRLCRKADRKVHRKGELYERQKIEVGGDPPIVSCDGVYPRYVMNDPREIDLKLQQTST